jgi:hypothetical protein
MKTATNEIDFFSSAREAVAILNEKYPEIFSKSAIGIIELNNIVTELGAKAFQVKDRVSWARFEVSNEECFIYLNSKPENIFKRLAFAHEIGHLFIYRFYRELFSKMSIQWHERFAQVFAKQLLVPIKWRKENATTFRNISQASDVLDLVRQVRIYIPWFISVMKEEDGWINGFDKIVMYGSLKANKYSLRDRKVRIVECLFDTSQFFIPTNKGINDLIPIVPQLKTLEIANPSNIDTTITLKRNRINQKPKFVDSTTKCWVNAIALQPTKLDNSPNYLLVIALK